MILVQKGDVIEIVLQNTLALAGGQELHPRVREQDFFSELFARMFFLVRVRHIANNCACKCADVHPRSYSKHLHLHNFLSGWARQLPHNVVREGH